MRREKLERLERLLQAPPPTTDEGRDELDRAWQEFLQADDEAWEQYVKEWRRQLEDAAGEAVVADFARGAEAVRAGLGSPEVSVRRLALYLAARQHPELLTATTLRQLIADDPDTDIRRSAISHLAWGHEGTNDAEVGALLAGLVSDRDEPECLRLDAYRGLIYLRGRKGHWYSGVAQLRFPEDVDWSLVARYLPGADAGRSAS